MTYDRELRTEAAHALTHNQEVWSDRGYAVVTAGGLSAGSTDFELDVGPYDVLVGDTDETSVGPTTLSVNAPDSDPYWLVVYVDSDGLQTEQGPEGEVFVGDQSVVASNADVREITSPAPPTLADIGPVTILGKVLVTSSGVTNSLIDDRTFGGGRIADSLAFRSLDGQIDTANLSDDAVTAAKLAANAVESGKIASDAVGVDELAAALGTDSANPVPGTSHFESLDVDGAEIAGRPIRPPITDESTVTETRGRAVSVSGNTMEVMLDVSEATVLYGGVVNGRAAVLGLTVDGTEVIAADENQEPVGADEAGDNYADETIPFAVAESSLKVEFFNTSSSTQTYGYKLWIEGWSP